MTGADARGARGGADDVAPPGALPRADGRLGLRERKRLAAMLRIQAVALDLFEARGFDSVTVEEVAEAADVSPSSVYRYFGTKEEIVLWDEYDADMDAQLELALAAEVPLDGVHQVVRAALVGLSRDGEETIRRRLRLMVTTPALEQAATARAYAVAELIGRLLARRLGRPEADLEVQVFSHALAGGLLGLFHHWHGSGFDEPLLDVVERTFAIFEEGLDVVTAIGSLRAGPAAEG